MSVTFGCPDAPIICELCEYCVRIREERDDVPAIDGEWAQGDLTEAQWMRARCGRWCGGTREVSLGPEVNFANANARNVLSLMGLGRELCGSLEPAQIPGVLRRTMLAINRDGEEHLFVTPARRRQGPVSVSEDASGVHHISRGCLLVEPGNSAEDTIRRLEAVREVLTYAHEHGFTVSWG